MRRLEVPFSAAALARKRLWVWAAIITGIALCVCLLFFTTFESLRPARFAFPEALYISLCAAAAYGFLTYSLGASYRPRRVSRLVAAGLFGSAAGLMILGFASRDWRLAPWAAVVAAVCGGVGAGTFSVLHSKRSLWRVLGWKVTYPADRPAAAAMYGASARAVEARGTSAEEKKVARLNMVHAAIARSLGDDAPDGLVRAAEELSELLEDPPDEWPKVISVATDLVEAMSVRAYKHGDLGGYPQALEVLATAANQVPADFGAMALVCQWRADYHMAIADRLDPSPEAAAQHRAAEENLRAAIAAVAPPLHGIRPVLHAKLGLLLGQTRARPGDLAAGIEECRTAIQLAGYRRRPRANAERALATLLIDLALDQAEVLVTDAPAELRQAAETAVRQALTEAGRLLRRAARHGGPDGRAEAAGLLARALATHAMILGGPRDDARAARAWRDAARAVVQQDPIDRVATAREWVAWAELTEDVTWCAGAYWNLMSVVPSAIAVRYLPEERDRVLAHLQFTAEEAGYWLARDGRVTQAAMALELGRAVSLSEVMGRERPDLPAALADVGREDLLARYQAALEQYAAALALPPGDGLSSVPQRAWSDYDAVMREIASVLGIDPPGALPKPADLAAAAAEGPVVYLAGASRGGYAIVVPPAGRPVYLPLPGLARADVAEHAESFLRGADPEEVESAVRWLWQGGMDGLSQDLRAGALVTVIPVGLLTLLPVHAAGGPTAAGQDAEDWDYLADRVTVRYAPNARALLHTRRRAGTLSPADLSLLAVAAPDLESGQPLPYTVPEVTQIARWWDKAETLTDAAPASVRRAMREHPVWHFACHCRVTPDRILHSALQLAGGQLSLRTILRLRPAPRRLAVLSACETHLSGRQLPDEAVGLPAGLLQVGFAGVVACHWNVIDRSTALLMVRFHELWHVHGLPPAHALAQAQRWLRTATPAELAAYRDGVHGWPGDEPGPRRAGSYGHPYFWAPFALTGH